MNTCGHLILQAYAEGAAEVSADILHHRGDAVLRITHYLTFKIVEIRSSKRPIEQWTAMEQVYFG
jgi:hypothetical protein